MPAIHCRLFNAHKIKNLQAVRPPPRAPKEVLLGDAPKEVTLGGAPKEVLSGGSHHARSSFFQRPVRAATAETAGFSA